MIHHIKEGQIHIKRVFQPGKTIVLSLKDIEFNDIKLPVENTCLIIFIEMWFDKENHYYYEDSDTTIEIRYNTEEGFSVNVLQIKNIYNLNVEMSKKLKSTCVYDNNKQSAKIKLNLNITYL
jgi:hypothetical protein